MTAAGWRNEIARLDASAALIWLEQLGFSHADDPELNYELAERYRAAGDQRRAATLFALVSGLGHPIFRLRALIAQAACMSDLGECDLAADLIEAARQHDPGSHFPIVARHDLDVRRGLAPDWESETRAAFEHLRPSCRADLLQHIARSLAHAHFTATRGLPSWGAKSCDPIPALARAGMLMMIKDEDDIIYQNLAHHHRIGFRSFCILDNASTDRTVALIRRFEAEHPDTLVMLVHDPVVGYYQSAKMDIFQQTFTRYAALSGRALDWLFFVDADEFIAFFEDDPASGAASLDRALSDSGLDLLILHWVHAAPQGFHETLPADYDPLKLFSRTMSRLEPIVSKIAFRTGCGFSPKMGNHFIETFDRPFDAALNAARLGWYMLHAQLRSLAQTRSKIINGGHAFRDAAGLEDHGAHWRNRFALYEQHGEPVVEQILRNYLDSVR